MAVEKKRGLGRGLESLLPKGAGAAAKMVEPKAEGRAHEIAVELIERNPYQTRQHFDEGLLAELAASIRAMGVIQPVLVRALPEGRFQLIAGERRWLASQKAGKTHIPAVVVAMNDGQAMEATIVENLQRADLNPMEQARAFERLGREFKMTQEQMAIRTGKDRASISNYLRLLRLPAELQAQVETGGLSYGHARALLALEGGEQMQKAASRVLSLGMSVRQTEGFVRGILDPERRAAKEEEAKPKQDPNVREAENILRRALGMRVSIEDKMGKGTVTINYADLEAFDSLMERLLGKWPS